MINKKTKNISLLVLVILFAFKNALCVDAHSNLLNILEKNYPLEITFQQTYKNEKINGWMVINGKGMARTEFAPPNNDIIVADGKWIIFYAPEIDRTTYIPLDKGIFKAFLNPKFLNENNKFNVSEVYKGSTISFIIEFNISDANQKIIISFDKDSKNLLGWKLFESNIDYISVDVVSSQKYDNSKFNKNGIFKLTEASRKSGNIYYGPYTKRKIKKVLGSGKSN